MDCRHQVTDGTRNLCGQQHGQQRAAQGPCKTEYAEITPGITNRRIGALQGKSQPDRAPFLGAPENIHGNGDIIAWLVALRHGNRLHHRLFRLQSPLADGIIEDFSELRSSSRDLLVSLLEECLPVLAVGEPSEN